MAWPGTTAAPSYFRGTITGSFLPITASGVYVHWLRFTHPEGASTAVTVNLANTAGDPIVSDTVVYPGVGFRDVLLFEECTGLKIKASSAVSLKYVIAYSLV